MKIPKRFYKRYGSQLNEEICLVDPMSNPIAVKLSIRVNNAVCTPFLEGMNRIREIYEVDQALCICFKFVRVSFFRIRIFRAQLHHEEIDYSVYSKKLTGTTVTSASAAHFVSCFTVKITKAQSTGSEPLVICGAHATDWFPNAVTHAPVLTADGDVREWKVVRGPNEEVLFDMEWSNFVKEHSVNENMSVEFLYSTHRHVFKISLLDA